MAPKSVTVKPKRRRRPATAKDPLVGIRLPAEMLAAVDRWAATNNASSRSQAIRGLIDVALAAAELHGPMSPKARSMALELAGKQLDKLLDPSASDEERAERKRRLLKGPKEFREMRDEIRSKSRS